MTPTPYRRPPLVHRAWATLKVDIPIAASDWHAARTHPAGTRVLVVWYPGRKYYKIQPFGHHWLGFSATPDEIADLVISDHKSNQEKESAE